MKTWSLVFSVAAALVVTTAFAQSLEYDDMYFNGKDRQKLKEKQTTEQTAYNQSASGRHKNSQGAGDAYATGSESSAQYSARNQNPEFAARSHSQAATDDADYFTSNYKYNNAATVSSFNNNYSNWYNSPWVANNYFGSSIYGWNSPYYGSYYDSWGNPWMNPYYRTGWSSSFSFYMGNSMNYGYGSSYGMGYGMGSMGIMGMGMSMCYGNPYNNSWAGWGGSSYGYGYGGMYGGYPTTVIVNNDNTNYAYGKRGAQNGMVTRRSVARTTLASPGSTTQGAISGTSRPVYNAASGGRVATNSAVTTPTPTRTQGQRQDDYYNRNWRSARQADTYGGSHGYTQPSRSSQSSGWNNSSQQTQWNSGRSSGGFDSGRSSSYGNGGGGATRSSAPASSGSNGRSRGRD